MIKLPKRACTDARVWLAGHESSSRRNLYLSCPRVDWLTFIYTPDEALDAILDHCGTHGESSDVVEYYRHRKYVPPYMVCSDNALITLYHSIVPFDRFEQALKLAIKLNRTVLSEDLPLYERKETHRRSGDVLSVRRCVGGRFCECRECEAVIWRADRKGESADKEKPAKKTRSK